MFHSSLARLFVDFVAFVQGSGAFSSCARRLKSNQEILLRASSTRLALASKDSTRVSVSNVQKIFGNFLTSKQLSSHRSSPYQKFEPHPSRETR